MFVDPLNPPLISGADSLFCRWTVMISPILVKHVPISEEISPNFSKTCSDLRRNFPDFIFWVGSLRNLSTAFKPTTGSFTKMVKWNTKMGKYNAKTRVLPVTYLDIGTIDVHLTECNKSTWRWHNTNDIPFKSLRTGYFDVSFRLHVCICCATVLSRTVDTIFKNINVYVAKAFPATILHTIVEIDWVNKNWMVVFDLPPSAFLVWSPACMLAISHTKAKKNITPSTAFSSEYVLSM